MFPIQFYFLTSCEIFQDKEKKQAQEDLAQAEKELMDIKESFEKARIELETLRQVIGLHYIKIFLF